MEHNKRQEVGIIIRDFKGKIAAEIKEAHKEKKTIFIIKKTKTISLDSSAR